MRKAFKNLILCSIDKKIIFFKDKKQSDIHAYRLTLIGHTHTGLQVNPSCQKETSFYHMILIYNKFLIGTREKKIY